eukprot:4145284-Lingulodinium_polyedra.AAC.1
MGDSAVATLHGVFRRSPIATPRRRASQVAPRGSAGSFRRSHQRVVCVVVDGRPPPATERRRRHQESQARDLAGGRGPQGVGPPRVPPPRP